jgi:sigma-B regulation protein RsbQ
MQRVPGEECGDDSAPRDWLYNERKVRGPVSAIQRNNVQVKGQGDRAMVFAHGFGCDQNMWRFVAPAFESRFKTVLFDHVGAGRSDLAAYDAAKYATLSGYAADLVEICRELGLKNAIFVGHSVSAMIGALAVQQAPEIFESLVMVGPSPRYIDDEGYFGGFKQTQIEELLDFLADNHMGWSAAMAPAIMGNPDRPELGEELTNSFCRTAPEIAKAFARVTFTSDNRADLPKVQTRTLVLQCSDDIIAPREVGDYVHRNMPNSNIVYLKATGHCPNLSAPQEVIEAIDAFV